MNILVTGNNDRLSVKEMEDIFSTRYPQADGIVLGGTPRLNRVVGFVGRKMKIPVISVSPDEQWGKQATTMRLNRLVDMSNEVVGFIKAYSTVAEYIFQRARRKNKNITTLIKK